MEETRIIISILAGGLLGILGQGIRIAVGLKKLNDNVKRQSEWRIASEQFDPSRLVISIFMGSVVGGLAMLIKLLLEDDPILRELEGLKTESIITIIAIGYSGVDFIEGVFNTYVKKFKPAPASFKD